MNLKFIPLLIFSLFTFCSLFGQDDSNEMYTRSVGLDVDFINNFLPLDNDIGFSDGYLLHFWKYKEANKFNRHAFDLNMQGSFENNENDINKNDAFVGIDYKFGKGKKKEIFNKASLVYGFEYLVGYSVNSRKLLDPIDPTETSFNTNRDQSIYFAFGPFVGFEYKLSNRFSVYTEGGYKLRLRYDNDKFTSEFDPELDFNDQTFSFADILNLPRSIILFYSF